MNSKLQDAYDKFMRAKEEESANILLSQAAPWEKGKSRLELAKARAGKYATPEDIRIEMEKLGWEEDIKSKKEAGARHQRMMSFYDRYGR
jgi:hypothetical protein